MSSSNSRLEAASFVTGPLGQFRADILSQSSLSVLPQYGRPFRIPVCSTTLLATTALLDCAKTGFLYSPRLPVCLV